MRITRIAAYQVGLPYTGGAYHGGRGRVIETVRVVYEDAAS